MSTPAKARTLIAEVKRRLEVARDLLARGAEVDVSPLEPALDALSAAIAGMPRDAALELKHDLLNLYTELDRLDADLTAAHRELAEKLKGLSHGSRATSAYVRQPDKG